MNCNHTPVLEPVKMNKERLEKIVAKFDSADNVLINVGTLSLLVKAADFLQKSIDYDMDRNVRAQARQVLNDLK